VLLLKFHGIWKPAYRIAERAHWKLNQDLAIGRRIVVNQEPLVLLPGLEPKSNVISFAAVDVPGLEFGFEQDVASVEIGEAHAPGMLALGQMHPTAVVEIKAQSLGTLLSW
jgi:hypothetical protein